MLKPSQISISGKIVGLVLFTVIVVGAAAFGSAYYFFTRSFEEQAEKRVNLTSKAVQGTLDDLADKVKRHAVSFSTRPDLAEAAEKKDTKRLQKIARELMTDNGLEVLTIAGSDGNVIARGHSEKTGDSVANQINVKKALAGEVSVGIEEGTVVAFSLRAGAPIKIDGRIVGTITPGIDLTATAAFVDDMKKRFNVECTVFKGGERVSTSLEKDGKRLAGTKMDNPEVIDTVLQKGLKYLDTNSIMGRVYNTAYWPVIGADAKIMGMLFVGSDRSSIEKACRTVITAVLISVLTVALIMVAIGYFLSRSLVRPMLRSMSIIDRGANEVSIAADQVSSSGQELAEGASEQAASIEETSSSLEEMSSMTKQNADNARQADRLMAGTKESVSRSTQIMDRLTTSMGEISKASEETSKIIRTIDEIAFQTNLLALNAAVEAARAGEAGAGFAVVADEVRNLAVRAAEAAKNTAGLIEGTVKKIKEGAELVEKTDAEFRQVALDVERSGDLVGQISAATADQSQGIEQINKAVSEMDKVVQQNAANAEESASASEELSAQAALMKDTVAELVAMVQGAKGNGNGTSGSLAGKAASKYLVTRDKKSSGPIQKGNGKDAAHSFKRKSRLEKVIPFDDLEISQF